MQWESYKAYFKYAGGWGIVFALNLIFLVFIFLSMAANFYMQKWAYEDQQT